MKTILTLDPATIDPDAKGRVGLFFPAKAAALGILMKQDGQGQPILVVKLAVKTSTRGDGTVTTSYPWKIVAGRHRLEGAIREGLQINAIEVSGSDISLHQLQVSESSPMPGRPRDRPR